MTVKTFNSTASNRVIAWGRAAHLNAYLNNRNNPYAPYRVGSTTFLRFTDWGQVTGDDVRQWAIDKDGKLWMWDANTKVPIKVDDVNTWHTISAMGGSYAGQLWASTLSDGKLYRITYDPNSNPALILTRVGTSTGWTDLRSTGNFSSAGGNWNVGIRAGFIHVWQGLNTPTNLFATGNFTEVAVENAAFTGGPRFIGLNNDGNVYRFQPSSTSFSSIGSFGGGIAITFPGKDVQATSNGVIVDSSGTKQLWVWGTNTNGQLGLGNTSNRTSPVNSRSNVRDAAFYPTTTFLTTTSGTVFTAGQPLGYPNGRSIPGSNVTSWTQITGMTAATPAYFPNTLHNNIRQFFNTGGQLYQWYSETESFNTAGRSDVYPSSTALPITDSRYFVGQDFTSLPTTTSWLTLYNHDGIVWGIDSTGSFKNWGDNRRGALVNGTYWPHSTPVAYDAATNWASIRFPFILRSTGDLYYWNRGGNSTSLTQITGTWRDAAWFQSATAFNLGIKSDGTLWYDILQTPIQIGTDTDWDSVYCGGLTAFALKTDGRLYYRDGTSMTQVSGTWSKIASLDSDTTTAIYTVGIKTDGTLWTWTLGTSPTQVGAATNWAGCAVTANSAMAWNNAGESYIIGNDGYNTYADWTLVSTLAPPITTFGSTAGYYLLWNEPQAAFTVTVTNTLVEITNNSLYASQYTVDWGDGTSNSFVNGQTGAPGVTPKLTHNYTITSDSKLTITLTASAGIYGSSSATQQVTIYIAQNPQITVINPDNTIPTATFLNSSLNTLGSTSVFGSGNFWRWDFAGTTVDVEAGSGQPGDRGVNITHLFSFTGPEIAARVPVNRTVTLYAYNGNTGSPFASTPVTVSVMPINPTFPNAEFTDPEDADIPDIFKAPGGIIWGKGTAL